MFGGIFNRNKPTNETPVPKRMKRSGVRGFAGGMFKAASQSNDNWNALPTSPDELIRIQHTSLVAKSREQWSNNDYVRGFVRLLRQNVVGPHGVRMQAKVTTARGALDLPTNTALEEDWCDFGKKGTCDVTGRYSFREIQVLALVTTARDGEFFVRKCYGAEVGAHGFALQLIDPQRCPVWRNEQNLRGGGYIRHGIEYNGWGRPVAYHFTSNDRDSLGYYGLSGVGMLRISADEIIHGFLPEMVDQKRGLPWTSTSLKRLRNVNGFEEAAVENARASATKMGFITYEDGTGPEMDDDCEVVIDAEPLAFHELPQGAKIAEWSPQFPNNETGTFIKTQLRGASSGLGVPYNELANDLEGVNFSSIRQMTLDAREHYMELQRWLIETLVEPVREAHLQFRLLSGAIKIGRKALDPSKIAAYRAVEWLPRRWTWIDPKADVDSKLAEIRGGLTSPGRAIRDKGEDPETVYQDIARDIAAMKKAGISEEFITLFFQGSIANNKKQGADEAPKKEQPA